MEMQVDRTDSDETPKSFLVLLPDAFAYPLKGSGWAIIIAGAVCFWVLNLIAAWSILGFILSLAVAGYLAAYTLKIIGRSAAGDEAPPDWPSPSGFLDEILWPWLLVLGTGAFSFFPLLIYLFTSDSDYGNLGRTFWTFFSAGLFYLPMGLSSYENFGRTSWFFFSVGLLYFPMGLLCVALFDSWNGLNPLVVLVGIVKVAPAYAVAVMFFFASILLSRILQDYISEAIPILGSFLAIAVSLYFLMVEMRILGLLYYVHKKRLGWFD